MFAPESNEELFEEICRLILNADRPSALLESICAFTCAHFGSLWTKGECMGKTMVLRSVYNRPNLEPMIGQTTISLKDKALTSAAIFETKEVLIGEVGRKPFDKSWFEREYTADLKDENICNIVLVPVFNYSDDPSKLIALYYSEPYDLDISLLSGLATLMRATNEVIEKRLGMIRLERRKDRHEILAHTTIIQDKLNVLRTALKNSDKDDPYEELKQKKRFDDIRRSAEILAQIPASSSFKDRVEERFADSEFIPIKGFLNDSLHSELSNVKSRNSILPKSILASRKLDVLFHKYDLTMFFNNIYNNAIKHAKKGSAIATEVGESNRSVIVKISNDVELDTNDDLDEIWDYRNRGESAVINKRIGEGLGLGLVQDICDVYDVDYVAWYSSPIDRKNVKVFNVSFTFPHRLFRTVQ